MKTKMTKKDIAHCILWSAIGITAFIGAAIYNPFHFGTAAICFWVASWRIDNVKKEGTK